MRLVFAGTPDVAVPSLDALLASSHEVVAVVTRPDAPAGRGKRLTASPVGLRAEEAGIPVLKPEHPRDEDFVAALTELAPDCCPVVAYGALVPQRVLDVPVHGWVNLHFSLLPAWRGAAPVQHAVLAGDQVTGASTFRLVREMDAGPVFGTVTDTIAPTDTSGDLLHRLSLSGAELLVRTLDQIEAGTATAVEQPTEGVTLAPKITVADAQISWDRPAEQIDRLVREMDAGPVFGTVTDTVAPTDTSGDLLHRLSLSGAELLVRTLDEIEAGTATAVEQPTEGVTLAPKITVADAQISWDRPAEEIDRLVRGCQPAPGAWTTFRGERFKVVSAEVAEETLAPGRIEVGRKSVLVGTGSTALRLGLVQPPGKKAMAAADWGRGVQLDADETLGAA